MRVTVHLPQEMLERIGDKPADFVKSAVQEYLEELGLL